MTQEFLRIIDEIKDSNKEDLINLSMNGTSYTTRVQHAISQLRGQILTLERIADIKEFLSELVETQPNTQTEDEVDDAGSNEDSEWF